jgi:putative ATPase
LGKSSLNENDIDQAAQRSLQFDQNGEQFYNLISAVHKSLRSSNPSAGVYWIVRMLEAGADPLYIARRLVRFAAEDIGNANPNALLLANQVYLACQNLGMPECGVHLVQLGEYLANSVKSNKAYTAYSKAKADVGKYGSLPVPMHFRNAPTKLMSELGYGKGYEYDHDLESQKSDQGCFPKELIDRDYFS